MKSRSRHPPEYTTLPRQSGVRRILTAATLAVSLCTVLPVAAENNSTQATRSATKITHKKSLAAGTREKKKAKAASKKKKTSTSGVHGTAQRDLDRVQEEIRSAEQRIKLTREQREQKEAELHQAELEIGELKNSVGSVQQDVSSREHRLRQLQEEKARRLQDRDHLVNLVKVDLQMAQRQGGQDYYKLLLNQQDPQALARLMKYYGYMQKARAGRVQALNENVARLEAISREEEESVQKLRELRGELRKKQGRLAAAQAQRTQAIRVLSAQIESEDEKLQRLRRDQQTLQNVVDRLAREAAEREQKDRERREREVERQRQANVSPKAEDGRDKQETGKAPGTEKSGQAEAADFRLMPYRGRCPLPVAGGVRAKFGSARAGGLHWNGVVIAAPAGTPVRAVRPGRVAFADYLRGYGFLIIVDHGRGLMSLYGQNQSLQKKAGDDVAGNEVIASVGDSGGSDADGLYFEIRVRGRPSDPADWCAYR